MSCAYIEKDDANIYGIVKCGEHKNVIMIINYHTGAFSMCPIFTKSSDDSFLCAVADAIIESLNEYKIEKDKND